MKCTRCHGLMVVDDLLDMHESYLSMWMRGLRCISCGNIVDPLIDRNRMSQQPNAERDLNSGGGCLYCLGTPRRPSSYPAIVPTRAVPHRAR